MCDTPACSAVIKVHPRRLHKQVIYHEPHGGRRATHGGKRWTWRTLHSCGAKAGGKQLLCHSPESQLHFCQERSKAVNFPMQLEKLVEDKAQVAPTTGESTCPRQDGKMLTPGRCLIPCSFPPGSEQTLGKSIKEGPCHNYITPE